MVLGVTRQQLVVTSCQEAMDALGAGASADLVLVVDRAVPRWLGELVAIAHRHAAAVTVRLDAPSGLEGEALDGWEIGAATACLLARADRIEGLSPRRDDRVRSVVGELAP